MVKVNADLVAVAASPQLRCGKNVIFADDLLAGAFRAFIYGVLISARLTGRLGLLIFRVAVSRNVLPRLIRLTADISPRNRPHGMIARANPSILYFRR